MQLADGKLVKMSWLNIGVERHTNPTSRPTFLVDPCTLVPWNDETILTSRSISALKIRGD